MNLPINQKQLSWLMENYLIHQLDVQDSRTTTYTIVLRSKSGYNGDIILYTYRDVMNGGFGGYNDGTVGRIYWADEDTVREVAGVR